MTYTINPNAKNVWIRDNEDTMDLSPITDASSVYLENGRTIEQELGEGSMVSNIATVDTSMSKVIDGTLDGAYESGILYGRSLVNLIDFKTNEVSQNTNVNDYKLKYKLNTSKRYLLKFNGSSDIGEFQLAGILYDGTTWASETKTWVNGQNTFIFTPNKEAEYVRIRAFSGTVTSSNVMLLEYQEGMENWDIPYFTGMCDVKMPILRNVGKNLFDTENWYSHIKDVNGVSRNGEVITIDSSVNGNVCSQIRNKITWMNTNLDSTKNYVLSYSRDDDGKGMKGCILFGYTDGTYSSTLSNEDGRIKTTNDTSKILKGVIYSWSTQANNGVTKLSSIQLEETSTPTPYEDHKTNILHTPEEIVLRSLPNGVKDTYNVITGEYVKRIGEVVLDGSEDEDWVIWTGTANTESIATFQTRAEINSNKNISINSICDKFPTYISATSLNRVLGEGVATNSGFVFIRINKSKLSTLDVQGIKTYLSQNPITVQYELATPIIATVDPIGVPFAYENGHVILESGYEGQSLLPTLEYSTVVNKTGQIQSVAKTIVKQEEQLSSLEKMLTQSIVEMDYNNTLLTLNLEIDEVM